MAETCFPVSIEKQPRYTGLSRMSSTGENIIVPLPAVEADTEMLSGKSVGSWVQGTMTG